MASYATLQQFLLASFGRELEDMRAAIGARGSSPRGGASSCPAPPSQDYHPPPCA